MRRWRKKVRLEAGLRAQGSLCDITEDLIARGSTRYTPQDVLQCKVDLERKTLEYQRFLQSYYR